MKILIANKFYYRRGGDCIYALNLEQMLRDRGHEVAVFAMDYPENLPTPWQKYFPKNMTRLMALTRPFGSREVRRKFSALLDDFAPDVVHLNNIHTHISPVIAELAHARGIRTVWTLHDYKLLCPRYDCMLGGMNPCQRCFGDNKRGCLDYSCIKGSKLQSAVGYREARHWSRRRLERAVDMFICPSAFMAENMKAGGFDPTKLTVLNNFIDTDRWLASTETTSSDIDSLTAEPYYCYVGRLSREKGVRTLVEAAAMNSRRLILIGNGPLEAELRSKAGRNVVFAGFRTPADVRVLVARPNDGSAVGMLRKQSAFGYRSPDHGNPHPRSRHRRYSRAHRAGSQRRHLRIGQPARPVGSNRTPVGHDIRPQRHIAQRHIAF